MRILGVIPARKDSKGLPGKNIKLLRGKPLICYTIEQALESNIDKIIVTTDSNEVRDICNNYSLEVIQRPNDLASDETSMLQVLQHVLSKVDNYYDAIMTLQPTSPMRKAYHINESIELINNDSEADSLVSVTEVTHNCTPEKIMTYDGKYLSGNKLIRRRQDINKYYCRNGAAIYITRKELIDSCIMGKYVLPFFMNKIESLDIDDLEDWKIVEAVMRNTA